jgi:hypothetical protein
LPTIAEVKYSGIPISRERKFGDAKLPDFLAPHPLEASQTMSKLSLTLRSQVRIGDRVTIVGGGEGVTAVVAAKAVGEKVPLFATRETAGTSTKSRRPWPK